MRESETNTGSAEAKSRQENERQKPTVDTTDTEEIVMIDNEDDTPWYFLCFAKSRCVQICVAVPFVLFSYPFVATKICYGGMGDVHSKYARLFKESTPPEITYAMFNYVTFWVTFFMYWIPMVMGVDMTALDDELAVDSITCVNAVFNLSVDFWQNWNECVFNFSLSFITILVAVQLTATLICDIAAPTYTPISPYQFLHVFLHDEQISKDRDFQGYVPFVSLSALFILCLWTCLPLTKALSNGFLLLMRDNAEWDLASWYILGVAMSYVLVYQFSYIRMLFLIYVLFPIILLFRLLCCCMYFEALNDFELILIGLWNRI